MFAVGTDKSFLFKEEDNWGVVPSQTDATNLRRANASFDVVTELYTSNEIDIAQANVESTVVDTNVISLLHFDTSPFVDAVGNTVVKTGNVNLSSNVVAFGNSASTVGVTTPSYLTLQNASDYVFGTGDFTIECWVSTTPAFNGGVVWSAGSFLSSRGFYLSTELQSGSMVRLGFNAMRPSAFTLCSASVALASMTYPNKLHIACVKKAGVARMYISGVSTAPATDTTNVTSVSRVRLFTMSDNSNPDVVNLSNQFYGYIDEYRACKEAKYAANFTVPSSAFTNTTTAITSGFSNSKQIRKVTRGLRNAKGSIKAELSAGTYAKLIANAIASNYSHDVDILDLSIKIEQNLSDSSTYDITRQLGSWVVDGFTAGTVVRLDGPLLNVNNKLNNLYICSLTETVLTVYPLNTVGLTIQSSFVYPNRCYTVGAIAYAKKTDQIDKSFSFEERDHRLGISELYSGNKVKAFEVNTEVKSGLPTIDFELLGRDLVRKESTQYFDDAPYGTTQVVSPVCTKAFIDNSMIGIMTGLTLRVERELQPNHIVGSKQSIAISESMLNVNGSFTVYFKDASLKQRYYNETICSLTVVFADSLAKDAQVISFCLPKVVLKSKRKNDNAGMLYDTYEFTAVLNNDNNQYLKTTISIQDSEVEGE